MMAGNKLDKRIFGDNRRFNSDMIAENLPTLADLSPIDCRPFADRLPTFRRPLPTFRRPIADL